ncbi:uncharacterized protein ARB_00690 [Trichophyton benhamiae CBS 112371]|uniref:Uncharacterized protein n=1 Tax=Arthroderma benhamiae (strain ATCC MYA-4681 / CBS 112371) TaxID=663331 RepID=D4AWX4_ARTBC|nr:uncharacterized protein ARB_00690 [Trichophyton benhamiae CBS 112371]EFE32505.1 hypothetical protein ARB_00690 [Trichophyton benhamiae CBS 112371]
MSDKPEKPNMPEITQSVETPEDTNQSDPESEPYSDLDGRPYSYRQCVAALQAEGVPKDLSSKTARWCVVRGIRTSYEYATSPGVSRICDDMTIPQFARARNARLIMSNVIPEGMEDPRVQPYCIWIPDCASADTYRKLVHRYPAMLYQVGRACGAAGYADLYKELVKDFKLLPEVSIAEEARESGTDGGREIYRLILESPIKYTVLDDNTRGINVDNPRFPAYLNGDTAVRWKVEPRGDLLEDGEYDQGDQDIEEDNRLDVAAAYLDDQYRCLSAEEAKWFYQPLPADIPTVKKELLRDMAAYEGNIDRYHRLMEPQEMTHSEVTCVTRGIYHNTMFARWWMDQLEMNTSRIPKQDVWRIRSAINARRIMINDISGFHDEMEGKPYLIWWPLKPHRKCLEALAKKCPSMQEQIAIACIFCDYQDIYQSINPVPHWRIRLAATKNPNPFYLADIDKRASEQGIDVTERPGERDGKKDSLSSDIEPTSMWVESPINESTMVSRSPDFHPYFGSRVEPGIIERYVFKSPEVLQKIEALRTRCFGDDTDLLKE